jgi:hypothetical protein
MAQTKIGWRPYVNPISSLLTSIYGAWNGDTTSTVTTLNSSVYAAYNGESNANDSFGTNNGTAQGGLTYGTGKIGNAFQFNGSNSYVSLPNNSFNSLTNDFSVSGWLYMPANTSDSYCVLLSNVSNDYTTGKGWNVFTYGNNIYFDVFYSGVYQYPNSAYVRLQVNNTLTNNTWNHIVIARKNSTSSKIYINGSLIGSNTSTQNPATPTAAITPTIGVLSSVGVGNPQSSYAPNGTKIDAVNVWNKELTQSEITELYNSGNGAQYITDSFYKPTTSDALGTNNGTAQGGLTYGVGKVGTAFNFNGTNAFIKYPANSMSFTGDFSISVWVNIPSGYIGSSEIDLLTNITMPYWYNSPKGFWFRTVGASLYFSLSNGTTSDGVVWNDSQGLIIKGNSGWINIVATRKSSTRSNLYVNGVLKVSNTSTFNPSYSLTNQTPASGALHIVNSAGVVQQNSVFAPNGTKIDGLSVWSKELTASEITELYNSGNGKQYPN